MILLSSLCSNTLQLTGTTSAYGTWTASEWVCLWVSCPPTCTPGQGTTTTTPPPPRFLRGEAQVHSWDEACRMIQWVLTSAHGEPPPTRWYIMIHHQKHAKVHYLCFWTCQWQPKGQIRKCHGSSHCSALCSPNSETKVRFMKIFSRVFLHLCSKKAEKPNEQFTLIIIY